jgi:glucan 1,3-beta-glucosidase
MLFHDSFRPHYVLWKDFFDGCENCAIDMHMYQAWSDPKPIDQFVADTCKDGETVRTFESHGIPVVVGEWSLATDNCAMWLDGLNDNSK